MRPSDDCDVDRAQQQKCSSYRNLSLLGTGSFSEVFKVRDCETHQIYALKRSKKEMKTQKTVNDALNEVQIMEKLKTLCKNLMSKEEQNHDDDEKDTMADVNIALFHNHWFSSDGRLFQLFEFCEHGTLRQLIDDSEEQLTPLQSLQCVRQISCGLEIVHSAQVIHLDLKPENVLIDSNRVLKICDFGISFDGEGNEERKFEFSGDPTYIAPEVLQSLNHELTDDICDRTDIFSLGVMFLEMRCGIELNKMTNKYERLRQLRSDEVDFEGILTEKRSNLKGKGAKLEVEEEHAVVSDIESLCRRMLCNASQLRPTASAVRSEIDRVVADHELTEDMDGICMLFERDCGTPTPTPPASPTTAHTPTPPQRSSNSMLAFMTPAAAPAPSKKITPPLSSSNAMLAFMTPAPAPTRNCKLQLQRVDEDVFTVQPLRNFCDLQSSNKGANVSKLRSNKGTPAEKVTVCPMTPSTRNRPVFGIIAPFSPSPSPPNRNRGRSRMSASPQNGTFPNQSPARVDRSRNRSFMTPHRKPSKMEPFQMSALFSPSSPAKAMFSPSSNETPLRVKPRSLSFGLTSNRKERDSDDFSQRTTSTSETQEDLRPSKELSFLDQIANAGDNSSDDMLSDVDDDADLELKQNEIAEWKGVTATMSRFDRDNPSDESEDAEMSVNLEPNENVVSAQQSDIWLTAAMAASPERAAAMPSPEMAAMTFPETPDVYFGRLSRILAESPQSSQHPLTPILERAVTGDQNAQMALLRALIERQQNMVSNGNEAETVDRLWADVYRLDREMVGAGNDPMLTYRLLLEQIAVHARASILSTPPRRPRRPQCSQSADRLMFLNTPSPVARPRGSQSTDRVRRLRRQTMRQIMEVEVEDEAEEEPDDDDEQAPFPFPSPSKTANHSSADLFLID